MTVPVDGSNQKPKKKKKKKRRIKMGWTYFEKSSNVTEWFKDHLTWDAYQVTPLMLRWMRTFNIIIISYCYSNGILIDLDYIIKKPHCTG